MSIESMADIAYRSRTDVGKPGYWPKTLRELAGAAGGKDTSEDQIATALRTLTTYIPTEILTLYVAVLAALKPAAQAATSSWTTFWFFLIATPIAVWVVFAGKLKMAGKPISWAPGKWPLWEMVAGAIAYVAWAFALPTTPFSSHAWYSSALAGVVVLITSTVLGLLGPLFARPLKP